MEKSQPNFNIKRGGQKKAKMEKCQSGFYVKKGKKKLKWKINIFESQPSAPMGKTEFILGLQRTLPRSQAVTGPI